MSARRLPLAFALFAVLALPAHAEERAPPSVTVSGEAHEDFKPDIAIVSLELSADKPTAAEASNEVARLAGAVIDGLKGSGVEAKDVMTVGASLFPTFSEQRDPKTNALVRSVVTGYRARNELRVRLRDIERAGAIIGASVQNGALYQGLSYDLSDRDARLDALRGKAAANAARRAGLYAEGVGMKLGPVRNLDATDGRGDGLMPKGAPRALAMAPAAAPLPIEAGTITLEDSVTATFDLLPP